MRINEAGIDEDVPSLALLLWTERQGAGLTVRELARRADVPASQITRVEKQEIRKPSSDFLIAIARALGKPPEPLLYLAGHISEQELERLTRNWRQTLEDVETAYSIVTGCIEEGNHALAAQGAFFGPGAAEFAASMLSIGGRQTERELRDLLSMWQALTPDRRNLVLAFCADQERLSVLDRKGTAPGRYRARVTVDEPERS